MVLGAGSIARCLGTLEPGRREERQLWLGVAGRHHNSYFGRICMYRLFRRRFTIIIVSMEIIINNNNIL